MPHGQLSPIAKAILAAKPRRSPDDPGYLYSVYAAVVRSLAEHNSHWVPDGRPDYWTPPRYLRIELTNIAAELEAYGGSPTEP